MPRKDAMALRWISALAGIPLYVGLCLWGSGPFTTGILVIAAIGAWELVRAFRATDIRPSWILVLAGLALSLVGYVPTAGYLYQYVLSRSYQVAGLILFAAAAAFLAAWVWEVVGAARDAAARPALNIAYGLLCGAYIGLFGALALLRNCSASTARHFPRAMWSTLDVGAALVLLVTFCVWATDTFALFVGRAAGRRKLAPALSPGKTIEGAAGGLAAALLVGAGFGALLFGSVGLGLAVGATAGVVGQVGDLVESAIKREIGVKDLGGILPGHGGVLDRFDSLVFAAAAVAVWVFFLRPM